MIKKIPKLSNGISSSGKKSVRLGDRLPVLPEMTLKKFFEEYNLMGYDNGDGELACSKVGWVAGSLIDSRLAFNKERGLYHIPNIISFKSDGKAILVDEVQIKASSKDKVYYNFKRCPVEAGQVYPDDPARRTYADLMAHSFACAIKTLLDQNSDETDKKTYLDLQKKTVILVGRPASKGWEAAEEDYEKILKSQLENYLGKEIADQITVLALSESHAAMAGALDMKQENWLDSFIRILDLGSSTFDITTVTPEGLHPDGEDSFTFGGGQLDKAMAAAAEYDFYSNYPKEKGYGFLEDSARVARLRFIKEECYGDNGCKLNIDLGLSYNFKIYQNGQPVPEKTNSKVVKTKSFVVSAEQMEDILNNNKHLPALRCKAKCLTGNAFHAETEKDSWMEVCEYVLRQFKEKTDRLYPDYRNPPQRLILTGGVSNMPEVKALAEKIFGVKAQNAKNPSLTVSNGLALILGNEIRKKILLEELNREIDRLIPSPEVLYEALITEVCNGDLDYYEEVIRQWAEGPDEKTLNACIACIEDENNGIFQSNDNFVKRACDSCFADVIPEVNELLREKFREMFPKFPKKFQFTVTGPNPDAETVKLANTFQYNYYMFFDATNYSEDYTGDTLFDPAQRQKMLEVYRSHRQGLATGAKLIYPDRSVIALVDALSGKPGDGVYSTISFGYRNQLTVEKDAASIREMAIADLRSQVSDFVESLTYYLAVSVGK